MKSLNINGLETDGVYQTFLSTLIFFSPNLLYLFDFFKDKVIILLVYNFIIIYLLVTAMAHSRFYAKE